MPIKLAASVAARAFNKAKRSWLVRTLRKLFKRFTGGATDATNGGLTAAAATPAGPAIKVQSPIQKMPEGAGQNVDGEDAEPDQGAGMCAQPDPDPVGRPADQRQLLGRLRRVNGGARSHQ